MRGLQEAPPTFNHVASDTSIVKMAPLLSGLLPSTLPSTLDNSDSSTATCTGSPSHGGGADSNGGGLRLANSSIVFSSGSSDLDTSREVVGGDDSPQRVNLDWSPGPHPPQIPSGSRGQSTEMVSTGLGAVEQCEEGDGCEDALDSDGLARVCDEAHSLMLRREEEHRAEIGRLSEQLTRARLEAAASNVGGGASRGEGQPPVEGARSNGEREIKSCSDENTVSEYSIYEVPCSLVHRCINRLCVWVQD